MEISNDRKTIKGCKAWKTCYGHKIISSINTGSYIWKIKVLGDNTGSTYFGIDNANAKFIEENFSDSSTKAMYAYRPWDGSFYPWNGGTMFGFQRLGNTNDILTMALKINDNKGIFTLKINDGTEFIVVQNVSQSKDLNYRFAIAIYGDRSYQIMN